MQNILKEHFICVVSFPLLKILIALNSMSSTTTSTRHLQIRMFILKTNVYLEVFTNEVGI
jgi:hypothetical protein